MEKNIIQNLVYAAASFQATINNSAFERDREPEKKPSKTNEKRRNNNKNHKKDPLRNVISYELRRWCFLAYIWCLVIRNIYMKSIYIKTYLFHMWF